MSDDKEKNNHKISLNNDGEIIFETTYEKVLFIINKVKDYIKNISSNETKLIEEIDWVIKVITNRSLYTYELVKEKIIKQNEEYDKFINFVKKYNEEVIEMNKKHDILISILNIRKKEDILLKPSLFLKKIENINKVGETNDKNKNSFVTAFGNYILNLYEQNKKEMSNDKSLKNNKLEIINNLSNELINEEGKTKQLKNNDKKLENKTINNTREVIKSNILNQKKINLDNDIISQQKILNKKLKNKYNIKLSNKNKEVIKLTKAEKNKFNQMKNIMRNYYLNFAINGHLTTNLNPNIFQTFMHNNNQKNLMSIKLIKKNRNASEKTYNLYKTVRPNLFSYNMNVKNRLNFHKNKISLSLQTSDDIFEEKYNLNNNKNKNNFKTISQNLSKDNKDNIIKKNIKLEKNNQSEEQKNNTIKNNFEINVKNSNKKISLEVLLNDNLTEFELITSFDFDIFELKKQVGYNNVLPLMGYIMLKTMGLVNNKIISTKKLESFLRTVSDNYKITTLYHNSIHGADITQSLFVFFLNSNLEEVCETTILDLLGLLISALGHDLGHPGLNNGYHINATTELGITYNDKSCLENFHSAYLFKILKKEENNILEKFSVQNYKTIRKRIISQILATDMAYHGETISLIRAKINENKGQERFIFLTGNDKTKFDEQQLLLNFLIHIADLGHNCKNFKISIKWIKLLSEEFWMQGDKEREKGLPISFLCDRNNIDTPTSQIGFLKGFIVTSYTCLVEMFPTLKFTVDNAENNIKQWKQLQKEKRLLGWTPEKKKKKEKDEKDD